MRAQIFLTFFLIAAVYNQSALANTSSRLECRDILSGIQKSIDEIGEHTIGRIDGLRNPGLPEETASSLIHAILSEEGSYFSLTLTAEQIDELVVRFFDPQLVHRSTSHLIGRFLNEKGLINTDTPVSGTSNIELEIRESARRAAATYEEDVQIVILQIHTELTKKNILLSSIESFDFVRTLESMSPVHMFSAILHDGNKISIDIPLSN